jgi:hypothetical protein
MTSDELLNDRSRNSSHFALRLLRNDMFVGTFCAVRAA